MTTTEKIIAMYHAERAFKIEAFWDGGIEFFKGNRIAGFEHVDSTDLTTVEEFERIVDAMWKEAGSPTGKAG